VRNERRTPGSAKGGEKLAAERQYGARRPFHKRSDQTLLKHLRGGGRPHMGRSCRIRRSEQRKSVLDKRTSFSTLEVVL
jgi:hypothetical protein